MSEGKYQYRTAKLKRKQKIKEISIKTLAIMSIAFSFAFCVVMFCWVYVLNQKLDEMTLQVENLTRMTAEQQAQLLQWKGKIDGNAQASTAGGQAESTAANNEQSESMAADEAGQAEAVSGNQESPVESIPAEEGSSVESTTVEAGNFAEPKADLNSISELQGKRKVYLTFDDGPSIYTDDILEILDKYQVKATFFVIGKEGDMAEEALQSIVAGGHTLGLHSYSHNYDTLYQSVETFAEDFTRLQDYVYEVTGVKSTVYRFPGGSSNTISDLSMQEFVDYLESQGVEFYDWSISAGDGGSVALDAQTIVKNCTRNYDFYNNVTILLHDSADKPTTVDALPIIIENILAMENTVILPITEDTLPVQHIDTKSKE